MTFDEWLKTPSVQRCYLVEVQYSLNSELKTFYRATAAYRTDAGDTPAYTPFPETIADMGEFERDMTEVYTGQSRSQSGEITFAIDDELREIALYGYVTDLNVTIKMGAPDWAYSEFQAVVKDAVCDDFVITSTDLVTLSFSDRASVFSTSIQPDLIAAGPNEGSPKPIGLGRCFNASPVLIDASTNTWMVHEGDIKEVTTLKESGNAISDFTDNFDGTFVVNRSVTGPLTVDFDGAVVGGVWLQTGEQFIDYILSKHGFPGAVDVDVFPDYLLGLYIDSDTNVDTIFDEIVSSFVASWRYDRQSQFRLKLKPVSS